MRGSHRHSNRSDVVYSISFPRLDCCTLTGHSLQDALKTFFRRIKTEEPRVDFYSMYKRKSAKYDTDYVKKYDENLDTTLIFGRYSSSYLVVHLTYSYRPAFSLPSAPPLSSTSIRISISIPTNSNPSPFFVPSSSLSTIPPVREDLASEIVVTTCLMYASLLVSLLAAFTAILGKQWLNRYLRNPGGSVPIERCGDRQRKCNGLLKWPLRFFIDSLPVILRAALLLVICGHPHLFHWKLTDDPTRERLAKGLSSIELEIIKKSVQEGSRTCHAQRWPTKQVLPSPRVYRHYFVILVKIRHERLQILFHNRTLVEIT